MMSRAFTKREKILLLVLSILLLGILYYQFVYKTTQKTIEKYDTTDLQTEFELEQTKTQNIKTMKAEIEANKGNDTGVVASYNNIKNEINKLNDILSEATSYNIDFAKAVKDGDAVRRDINITFSARSYKSAEAIIENIYSCRYRCLIRNIDLSKSESSDGLSSGAVTASLKVTFFETMYDADTTGGLEEATNNDQTGNTEQNQ